MRSDIFAAPKRQVTAEGIERDMAVSYLNRLVMLRNLASPGWERNTVKVRYGHACSSWDIRVMANSAHRTI